jgi:hypothetical protein
LTKLSARTRDKLKTVSTATLATALFKRGLRNQFIQDVHPLNPAAGPMRTSSPKRCAVAARSLGSIRQPKNAPRSISLNGGKKKSADRAINAGRKYPDAQAA